MPSSAATMRRNPLTDVQKQYVVPEADPPKQAEKQKEPGSPPLPRQNTKITPPSPPKVIVDRSRDTEFLRIGLLGEGGFARVYEIQDKRGAKSACKVVTKASLKTKKAKTKVSSPLFTDKLFINVPQALRRNQDTQGALPPKHRSLQRMF
jgi:cell cycle serine/threonine-protein kinase CDC5/MSD2